MTNILYTKLSIYYGSWLVFPLLYWFAKKRWFMMTLLSLLFIYARFIEPQLLFVHHYKIETGFKAKVALISDMHLGIYNDANILKRVVEKINKEKVDALLIAGDLTYEPQLSDMKKLFAPLQNVQVPIYVVLGNHDCQRPGPDIKDELIKVLKSFGVHIITNKAVKLNDITILGLGSLWAGDADITLLDKYTTKDNLIVLTHNPDTVLHYQPNHYPPLTLAGHTHGGQVRIPYLYKNMLPIKGDILWDQGLYTLQNGKVFVTSGIGEIGLPLRFLIPPTIDILELY